MSRYDQLHFIQMHPDMIHLRFVKKLGSADWFYRNENQMWFLLAMKHLIIENVCFQFPFSLLPDELKPLIDRYFICIPPVVYLYLLQFLCFYHLGDNRGKNNALHDLELTVKEQYFIVNNVTMLGIVHSSLHIVKALLWYQLRIYLKTRQCWEVPLLIAHVLLPRKHLKILILLLCWIM